MNWWENLKGKVRLREPLKGHTTFKIGGPAKYFIEPKDVADLKLLLGLAKGRNLPVFMIGAGSNILAGDKGINALVVKLNSPYFKKIDFKAVSFTVSSGCLLSRVINYSKNRGVSSLECLSGIPGTIGGALAMNAGIAGKNIGDLVEEVTIMDYNGKIKSLKKTQIKFGYRNSSLAKSVILSARFSCRHKKKQEIEASIREAFDWRRQKQELSLPSAGCVFKNPSGTVTAGKLIDLAGLKGKRIGDACISSKHANFIVNAGAASGKDVLALMRAIKRRVKDKFNIDLQPEIKIWK
jgi:UDP-N-acetylmuramate dehydrogenase